MVVGGEIPYQPWAAAKKAENFKNRQKADPLNQCFIPGVPRIMYLDFPFQIFQTSRAVAMAFEWSLDYRLIHTDGTPHPVDLDSWMGDSRGRWEGDTLVVDVSNNNDKTWFDMAGDFHSDALHVVERYRMTGPDTIQYQATVEDAKVFTKPWTIDIALRRRTDRNRLFEYVCQAEAEEASGAFTREERTWYPGSGTAAMATTSLITPPRSPVTPVNTVTNLRRPENGKPDLQGFYVARRRRRELRSGKTHRQQCHPGRTRSDHGSAQREFAYAAMGRAGKDRPEPDRTRLRRSHGALFPGRCSPIDVCPDGVSHCSNLGLHCLSA